MTNPKVVWGLWDSRGKCWLGNPQGPNRYEDKLMARAAATIATEMFGYHILPLPLPQEPMLWVGTTESKYDGPEAIDRIEKRAT